MNFEEWNEQHNSRPGWSVSERTEYAMWNDGRDWLVIAHGGPDCVSVQFHPPSKRLPKAAPVKPRELEVA